MKEIELIRLYFYLCECNNKELAMHHQRFSPNSSPKNEKLTDVELLTIYFYCRRFENKHIKSDIYDFANRFMRSWFPLLPAYANFNSRLNNLGGTIEALCNQVLRDLQNIDNQWTKTDISLVDSMPIMLCSGKRQGKIAPELSEKSYCSTKGIYYFGVKLHTIAFHRPRKLPLPEFIGITSASDHDLDAVRPILSSLSNRAIVGDKAYADLDLNADLDRQINSHIYTPVKLIKGQPQLYRQFKKAADDLYSKAVSSLRQPIEAFFNWLIEKTNIQKASKVRATKGLIVHIFGAIATAFLFWLF